MGTNQSGYVVQPVTDSNTLGVVQYCKDRNEFLFVKVVSLEAINVVEKWTRVTQNMHIGNTEKNYFLFNLSALYGLHLDTLHFTLNNCILSNLTVVSMFSFLTILFDVKQTFRR